MKHTADTYPRTRLTGAFERRVGVALRAHVEATVTLVAACSGGPDSTATLVAVARAHPGPVIAATFDHRMRAGAEAETEVVRRVACDLGLPLLEGRAASTLRGEDAARTARYRWLARACAEAGTDVCVTGHTRDDQAETVLLRLARGAGARGAAGMAPASPWPVPGRGTRGLQLVRPLLGVTRDEVEAYLAALGIEAVQDPSNATLDYARNRVRQAVLPALAEVNAQASAHLASFAQRQAEDDEALTEWARDWLEQHGTLTDEQAAIPRKALSALPGPVGRRVLQEAADRIGLALGSRQIQTLSRLISGSHGGAVALARGSVEVRGTVIRLRRRA